MYLPIIIGAYVIVDVSIKNISFTLPLLMFGGLIYGSIAYWNYFIYVDMTLGIMILLVSLFAVKK
jgi:hypothetical protein